MSGGGGGGQNTVTTQVEKLPAELVPFYQDLLGRGVYETLTGYETYPFRRLADFDPYEAGAQEAYANMALEGTPESFREAQEGLREIAVGSPYQRAVSGDQVTAGLFDTIGRAGATPDFYGPSRQSQPFSSLEEQQADPRVQRMNELSNQMSDMVSSRRDALYNRINDAGLSDLRGVGQTDEDVRRMREIQLQEELEADEGFIALRDEVDGLNRDIMTSSQPTSEMERYMNPFQQTFIDRQKELARQESARQQSEIGQQAAMAGGLGGYREGIMQAEREKNLMNQMQDIQAAGDMANFEQARRAYESDRQNRMDVADLGIRGYTTIGGDLDRRMRAAQSMADLSGTRQAMEFDRLGQLESAGSRRRALAQQGLDIGYQDFLRQQAFPREQLNLYSGLLRGVPVGPGTYKSVYGDQPSGFQQLLGGGLGAAALYGGLRGSSGGWGGSGNSWGGG